MIRPAQKEDIAALAQLEKICFSHPWSQRMLQDELDHPGSLLLLAEQEGRVIGYVGLRAVLDEGNILNVAVAPDCRRRGIASQLLERMLSLSERLCVFTLEVRQGNGAAIALYEKFGFRRVGVRKGYYCDPTEDAVLMIRYGNEDKR